VFIYGTSEVERFVDEGEFVCPGCRTAANYAIVQVHEYFHLYFVPLFHRRIAAEHVHCRSCQHRYPLTVLAATAPAVTSPHELFRDRLEPTLTAVGNVVALTAAAVEELKRRHNPIDVFKIADKLANSGCLARGRSPHAHPPLYFDLTRSAANAGGGRGVRRRHDPDAYERLVDRLLASPHYGERWARHWLDVVHYGETHGYDKDKPRPNAWPYRDYVIRSLNDDKPYARFVRSRSRAMCCFPGRVDGIEALGFIAAGPWDLIGHAEVPETKIDGKVARHLDRDDMVAEHHAPSTA
jgi:hypothetical protein